MPILDSNYSLQDPLVYETYGYSLGNTLYYNLKNKCQRTGYVHSVSLRLFNDWKGKGSLYLFVLSGLMLQHEIINRYAIKFEKNTTQWQTIIIPFRKLPIKANNFLAIGMQENNNENQIYAIKQVNGMRGLNISENVTKINSKIRMNESVAFSFTVISYNKSIDW